MPDVVPFLTYEDGIAALLTSYRSQGDSKKRARVRNEKRWRSVEASFLKTRKTHS